MKKVIKVIQLRTIPGLGRKLNDDNGQKISQSYLAQLAEDETPIFV